MDISFGVVGRVAARVTVIPNTNREYTVEFDMPDDPSWRAIHKFLKRYLDNEELAGHGLNMRFTQPNEFTDLYSNVVFLKGLTHSDYLVKLHLQLVQDFDYSVLEEDAVDVDWEKEGF